jgi:hypothetical protein
MSVRNVSRDSLFKATIVCVAFVLFLFVVFPGAREPPTHVCERIQIMWDQTDFIQKGSSTARPSIEMEYGPFGRGKNDLLKGTAGGWNFPELGNMNE